MTAGPDPPARLVLMNQPLWGTTPYGPVGDSRALRPDSRRPLGGADAPLSRTTRSDSPDTFNKKNKTLTLKTIIYTNRWEKVIPLNKRNDVFIS